MTWVPHPSFSRVRFFSRAQLVVSAPKPAAPRFFSALSSRSPPAHAACAGGSEGSAFRPLAAARSTRMFYGCPVPGSAEAGLFTWKRQQRLESQPQRPRFVRPRSGAPLEGDAVFAIFKRRRISALSISLTSYSTNRGAPREYIRRARAGATLSRSGPLSSNKTK